MLGRIQTAPAALSHMSAEAAPSSSSSRLAGPPGAAALSTSPSAGALVDREGEPPVVLLSDLHPSVSESALQLGDGSGSSGGGGGGNTSGHRGESEGAAAAGGEPLPAAAAAAPADGEEAGSGEQVVEDVEDEEESEEEQLAPAANPFELLAGSEDEGHASQPAAEQDAVGSEQGQEEPQPAAQASPQPELGSSSSGVSLLRESSTAEQPGPSAVQQAAPCETQQPSPEQCGCCARDGGSAAARLASGESQPQQREQQQQPSQQQLQQHGGDVGPPVPSSGGSGSASNAGERVPSYRLEQKQLDDGTDVIRLSVDLPGACGEDIDLRVSEDQRQLWLHAGPFGTTVPLPSMVEPIQRSVKWVKKSERLVAMFNVAAPAEE